MKYAKKENILTFFLFVVFIPIIIFRCTPEKHFTTLSIFFDGVPDPNKKTELITTTATTDSADAVVKPIEPEYFVHKPYDENKCESCHEKGFSNNLIVPMPELCYTCHEDFNLKYKSLHGPAASGYCTSCHHEHMAKSKYLLKRTDQQLCFFCHDSKQVLASKMHKNIGEKSCTECHSPHGGENKGMLSAGSCFNCHENFTSTFTNLHGPVASGYCTSCHDSHTSKTPNLLIAEGSQLCYTCHNSEQVNNNEVHKKNKKSSCTECHNPHGGDDRFLLKHSAIPDKGKSIIKVSNSTIADTLSNTKPVIINEKDSLK